MTDTDIASGGRRGLRQEDGAGRLRNMRDTTPSGRTPHVAVAFAQFAMEIDLGSNYAIRVEYRYSDYGDLAPQGVNTGVGMSRNQGIVTLLGKF